MAKKKKQTSKKPPQSNNQNEQRQTIQKLQALLRLINMLNMGQAPSANAVAKMLNVSRRTLFRYMDTLRESGMNIEWSRGAGYHVKNQLLTKPIELQLGEVLGLVLLTHLAKTELGMEPIRDADEAVRKLISNLPEELQDFYRDAVKDISIDPGVGPEKAVQKTQEELYPQLQQSIQEHWICDMVYQSPPENVDEDYRIHPYMLYYAKRTWYLFAYSVEHLEVRIFKVGRIQSLTPTKTRFQEPKPPFRPSQKLGKAWQLIREDERHQVELLFKPLVATNVSEVRWHSSQDSEVLADGSCRMTFEVDGLREISWWICGYAGQVEVVSPPALRTMVRDMLREAADQYD